MNYLEFQDKPVEFSVPQINLKMDKNHTKLSIMVFLLAMYVYGVGMFAVHLSQPEEPKFVATAIQKIKRIDRSMNIATIMPTNAISLNDIAMTTAKSMIQKKLQPKEDKEVFIEQGIALADPIIPFNAYAHSALGKAENSKKQDLTKSDVKLASVDLDKQAIQFDKNSQAKMLLELSKVYPDQTLPKPIIPKSKVVRLNLDRVNKADKIINLVASPLDLNSSKAIIFNETNGNAIYAKNYDRQAPIASITKLMTAMVVLDSQQPLDEVIEITDEDIDRLKNSSSKLNTGDRFTRHQLLEMALISSENKAAHALARTYPGGESSFVSYMNLKAMLIGMGDSNFVDSTGLNSHNTSTAYDLARMVKNAHQYPEIKQITTTASTKIESDNYQKVFNNTNRLVANNEWKIGLSKTGFINEAGRCLVMQVNIAQQDIIIVLLDADDKNARIDDVKRVKTWIEANQNAINIAMIDKTQEAMLFIEDR